MANELEEPYSEFVDSIYREENEPVKEFNTTAVCIPSKHYMVDLSGRMKEIKKLIDDNKISVRKMSDIEVIASHQPRC